MPVSSSSSSTVAGADGLEPGGDVAAATAGQHDEVAVDGAAVGQVHAGDAAKPGRVVGGGEAVDHDAVEQRDAGRRRATALRSTHSKVVRRQARATRSSSPGRGLRSSIVSGMPSANRSSVAPASSSAASTSGWRSRSRLRSRARKAWLWRTCGAPRRSHQNAASGSAGRGVASRSSTVTSWPARPRASAAPSPATPAPTTTIRAIGPSHSFLDRPVKFAGERRPAELSTRRLRVLIEGA